MAALKWLLGSLVVFGCFVLVMYLTQRSLMYFPERTRTSPAAAGFAAAEEIVLDTADGEKVIAWHVPPRGDKPVILYFHGNGGVAALPRRALQRADGRRHRPARAELSRLWRLDRPADRSRV